MLECLDPHSVQRGPGEGVILSHICREDVGGGVWVHEQSSWTNCDNKNDPTIKWSRLKFHEVLLSMVAKCIHV